ncbi:RNA-guided endonuclease TnpB family protein [Micromonospora sp. CPCC 206171]|uniref:RNA-guided endonuclease InsQ/TnpB family protein n=1 Tax=Micromonospora sp. CPCC 206171 TaxID=3122405 RepID=UPI002FF2F563
MGRAIKRSFKYRFYPTPEQAEQLNRTLGCVRLVFNRALEECIRLRRANGRTMSYTETSAELTQWKRTDLTFLNEVSSVPLQQALRHLQSTFSAFLRKKAQHPRFKSKRKSRAAAEYTRSAFRWRDGNLTLAKMKQPLNVVWSRSLPAGTEPSTVTVSRDSAGRWFVSLLVEDSSLQPLPPTTQAVGVDLGLTTLATLSTGEKIADPRHEGRERRRLGRAQRRLSRKQHGSANQLKARLSVARIQTRIADRRRDHLHQLTSRLVRENQTVVIEDLSIRNMKRNHRLARGISDAAWWQMRRMLEYKADWYGRRVLVIGRWQPSSKRCSTCGRVRESLPLSTRSWTCECRAVHDRDVNAARNILAAGLAER